MGSLPRQIKNVVKIDIAVMLVIVIALNPLSGPFFMAVNNQEFFTYHIRDIFEYFAEEKHDTAEFYLAAGTYENQTGGELFGAAEGRNLIVIQMESIQNLVVDRDYFGQDIMPVLNGMIHNPGTVYFNNFYSQIGSGNTSDAEFAANNSIMASVESYTYQLYQNNYFRGLPWILKEHGYRSYVLHGYKKKFWNREAIYPVLGFERFFSDDDFINDNIEGIGGGNIVGISDHAFYEQASVYMEEFTQPFYSLLITLSTHHSFKLPEYLREIKIRPQEDNIVGDYINSAHYTDKCIGEFIELMKEKGLYDNSIFVFYGDHFGLSKADKRIDDTLPGWLGAPYRYDQMMNVPLIIHIPGTDINAVYENSGGQIDFMPTMAYLLGIEKLDTLYFGQNLFTGEDSIVAVQTHMLKGSYIKGDQVFEISRDGIFENSRAWDRRTGDETIIDGCAENSLKAKSVIELSLFYLKNDILRLALERSMNVSEINEVIAGNEVALPDMMEGRYIAGDDMDAIDKFYKSMLQDKGKYALLMSDDIDALLQNIEVEYSGKSKVKGIGSTDKAANAEYVDIRGRIVPAVSPGDNYTKVQYLGYDKIILNTGDDAVLSEQFLELINADNPCGIAVSRNNWRANMNIWAGSKLPVYIYNAHVLTGSDVMQVYRQPWK